MLRIVLALTLLALPATATEIYRWVDDKGQVHFSSSPPPEAASIAEEVNIRFNVDAQKPAARQSYSDYDDYDADEADDAQSQAARPKTAADMKREQQDEWRYQCEKAVKTAKSEYEVGVDVIKQNHSGGYISADKMKQQIDGLSAASKSVSMHECIGSTGDKKRNYQCLADYKGLNNCGFGSFL